MIPDDLIIFSIPGMLKHSKRRSYREETKVAFTTMCRFLQDNGLMNIQLLAEGQQLSDALEVRKKDFTEEGFEFYRRAEQKWFNGHDRGVPLTDTSILERELRNLRKENMTKNQ